MLKNEKSSMSEQVKMISIGRLQREFDFSAPRRPYFFVDFGKEPYYTDEPFRTETYSIVWLRKGVMDLQTDLTNYIVNGPALITIGPNVTRSFHRAVEQPEMQLFFFTGDYLTETLANVFYLDRFRFFESNDHHVLALLDEEAERMAAIFELIGQTFGKEHLNEAALMRTYGHLLIHEIDAMHRGRSLPVQPDESNVLFIRFRNLLIKEFWKHRTVGFYADKLNVTPKYLSEIVKKQSGRTAGEWIDKAVLLEAKILLQNRALSIAQVSDRLHFSDQSVFGKFFKTQDGRTPAEYRKTC